MPDGLVAGLLLFAFVMGFLVGVRLGHTAA
jgi:hypothetical protein